jgi:hypothetical protein
MSKSPSSAPIFMALTRRCERDSWISRWKRTANAGLISGIAVVHRIIRYVSGADLLPTFLGRAEKIQSTPFSRKPSQLPFSAAPLEHSRQVCHQPARLKLRLPSGRRCPPSSKPPQPLGTPPYRTPYCKFARDTLSTTAGRLRKTKPPSSRRRVLAMHRPESFLSPVSRFPVRA